MSATSKKSAVLAIGDNGLEREFIARAFEKAGLRNPVHVLKDTEEGKKYLQGHGPYGDRSRFPFPRLLLLDYKNPDPNAWEMLRWMRSQANSINIPIVIFSSVANPDNEKRATDSAAAYHLKPQQSEKYEELIRRIGEFWLLETIA